MRAAIEPRYWHMILYAVGGAGIFFTADYVSLRHTGALPRLMEIWTLSALVPLLCGALSTLGAGGAELWKRIIGSALCGSVMGLASTVFTGLIGYSELIGFGELVVRCAWSVFIFAILTTLGAIITELQLPEP